MTIRKPILCLDFDGVIHSYTSGWKGADVIPDAPVPGAIAFIEGARTRFQVAIFSSRSNQFGGIAAMKAYLEDCIREYLAKEWGLGGSDRREVVEAWMEDISFPTEKPPALVTIDDRAIQFTGQWPTYRELLDFQPWNKRHIADQGERMSGAQIRDYSQQIRGFVAEIDELPDPGKTLVSANERKLIQLLKRIADALR